MLLNSGPNWTDQLSAYSSIALALIAIVSAGFIVFSLRQTASALRSQRAASDIQTTLAVWERLDHHWQRFRNAESEDQTFEFGQLTSYYELACALFRERALSTTASRTLGEHLRDILPQMLKHPPFKKLYDKLNTNEDTYANIRWFLENGKRALEMSARPHT